MREIKFRAYIKEDYNEELVGKMLDVSSIHLKTGKVIIGYSLRNSNYGNKSFLYKNIELMQYTGLHDKNGKEIYEGDIIKKVFYKYSNDEFGHKGFYELICKIIWQDGLGFTFRKIRENEIEMPEEYREPYDEVIGNIYENSNLLKGADNIL